MQAGNVANARPRTPEEVTSLSNSPDVLATAERIQVVNVLHFTTMHGLVGILAAKAVKSRYRLPNEEYLKHVYKPNVSFRKDPAWLDYANLSIERINDWMFDASKRWHATAANPWVVLSFHPRILAHPGVVFTTTNNIYPECRRAEGLAGFKQMFADHVRGRHHKIHDRNGKRPAWPTDRQAEVLYPGQLSCRHVQRIYVQNEEDEEGVVGALRALGGLVSQVQVLHAPEVFE